jgi:hypothetical protein
MTRMKRKRKRRRRRKKRRRRVRVKIAAMKEETVSAPSALPESQSAQHLRQPIQ